MKNIRTILPIFLIVILFTSCSVSASSNQMSQPKTMEAQVTIATATPLLPPPPLTATKTSLPLAQSSSTPVPGIPTTVTIDDSLTWMECVLPRQDYAYSTDIEFVTNCLGREQPRPDNNDKKLHGERIEGEINDNLRMVVAADIYETRFLRGGDGADYELLKNGEAIAKASAAWSTFDPNQNLWNVGGKVVWELANPSVIIVDGVNQNEKHQFEGTYFPYVINDKLIYVAVKDNKYHIVYDENIIGPEFDWIYLGYCCGNTSVFRGQGQYWFWGKREGSSFVVVID